MEIVVKMNFYSLSNTHFRIFDLYGAYLLILCRVFHESMFLVESIGGLKSFALCLVLPPDLILSVGSANTYQHEND